MAQGDNTKPSSQPRTSSKRPPTFGQKLLVGLTLLVFLMMTLFYTMIPIAGLQLLPFLFFGCVSLIVGVCDDLGLYR